MTLISPGLSTPARADDLGRCPPIGGEPLTVSSAEDSSAPEYGEGDASSGDFRQKAAPFAPDIVLRIWYQERTHNQGRARSHAIAQLATPDQMMSITHEPFGWQVSVRWNLIDIADTILPGDETPLRIYASDCAAFQRPSDSLFELGLADDLEVSSRVEEDMQTQGDLQ